MVSFGKETLRAPFKRSRYDMIYTIWAGLTGCILKILKNRANPVHNLTILRPEPYHGVFENAAGGRL